MFFVRGDFVRRVVVNVAVLPADGAADHVFCASRVDGVWSVFTR